MSKKSKGFRSRTRKILKSKRKPTIIDYLKDLKIGEKVKIIPEPSSHKGMPELRFKGKIGHIINKRGNAYMVEIKDGNKEKKVISNPEHLKSMR